MLQDFSMAMSHSFRTLYDSTARFFSNSYRVLDFSLIWLMINYKIFTIKWSILRRTPVIFARWGITRTADGIVNVSPNGPDEMLLCLLKCVFLCPFVASYILVPLQEFRLFEVIGDLLLLKQHPLQGRRHAIVVSFVRGTRTLSCWLPLFPFLPLFFG